MKTNAATQMANWIFVACALIGCSGAMAQSLANDSISLPWTERKPFQYQSDDGKLHGILYDLGEQVFGKAAIAARWVNIPANRIALMLEDSKTSTCLVGWFKTPAREKIAKFTTPIYRDKPLRGVVRTDSGMRAGISIKSLFDEQTLTVLVKEGYSYGNTLDELIASRNGKAIEKSVGDHSALLSMVEAQRAKVVFLPQEEIDFYAASNPSFQKTFSVIPFAELSDGNLRHIICTRSVPDETIMALNAAIKATVKLK